MREGKARVIIGDTLSKCEALARMGMLYFCTFKDFFITFNSLHLYINLEICKVTFSIPDSIRLFPNSVEGAEQVFGKQIFILCLLSSTMSGTKDKIVSSGRWTLPSPSLELNVGVGHIVAIHCCNRV